LTVILENLGAYGQGLWVTVQLTLLSFTAAFVGGVIVAAFRVSPIPPLRAAGAVWVELLRNTPLTVLMVLFAFGFTKVGIQYSFFTSAVIVLGAYTSTFIAETVRSGINSVSRGQAEAARAIGLTFPQTLTLVVVPQALRTVVAPIGNVFIALTKNSSIASVIAVAEITKVAHDLNTATAQPIPVFLGAGAAYLLLTFPSGYAVGFIERRVRVLR
jgi:glutamate transport system permease protein